MYLEEGENAGYFAWSVQPDGTKNSFGAAPDGEEFFAMALFFAAHRWGDGEGIFNYSREAKELLHTCIHKGENGVLAAESSVLPVLLSVHIRSRRSRQHCMRWVFPPNRHRYTRRSLLSSSLRSRRLLFIHALSSQLIDIID